MPINLYLCNCYLPMETYIKIAKLLEVELSELVNSKFGNTI